ncbi:dynein associated protein-domain-containing protein, partial [Gamsiella multidivaricata]|uniref:dynein associated protein-domain-containing protein n=1 Tax=Gamsiella multidivaricata TaxID=101098 RepID=UPI00221FD0E2
DAAANLSIGTRVEVGGNLGFVRYVGQTSFATGRWVGVELDVKAGKNSGVVEGKRYFDCKTGHGVFVRASQAHPVVEGAAQHFFLMHMLPGCLRYDKQPETTGAGKTSRPTSMVGRPAASTGSRVGAPTRPSTARTGAAGSAAPSPASIPASRLTRPTATRRTVGAEAAPEPAASPRRIRVASQPLKDEETERFRSSALPSAGVQQQLPPQQDPQDTLVPEVEEDNAHLLAQEQSIMEELEAEEALAQRQLLQDQQGFAPPPPPYTAPSAGPQPQATVAAGQRSEAMVPLKEYDELRIKLRLLESKRTEDREKIREAEKAKEESEQFLNIRTKLQAKLTEMQQELRDSKRILKEATAEKEAFEAKYNDVVDSMEVTLLDKEMAEERAENLQHEVNILKEKVEEMHVDLNVFQQEESGMSNPAVNQIQLERQNERLKEALLKLRDMTSEQEAEMTRKLKNLEKEASLVQEVQIQNEKLRESLELAEGQNEELKQRLDDAIGAEDMIEQLSEKNITLSEKIEEMQMAIDDLEALKELNDELEENHSETEKQLQAEINMKDIQLREHQKKIETLEENVADYENTIIQFRELVAHLQSDLEQLRHKEETASGGLGSQSQAMLSLNLQLQSTAMKAQAKAIDLELRKLDALQANDNLTLVQPYLPDGFFRTENDSIQCFLLFKRLSFKAELMSKHLEQQYGIADKIAQNAIPSELVSVCEVRQKLTWFGDMAKRFVSYIEGCPVDVFAKMGQVYHDLIGTERRLNNWMEQLRKEELKESDCIVDLQRAIAQLDHLAETYLTNTKLDLTERYQGAAHALDLNFDRVFVNMTAIGAMFKSNEDGVRLVDTDDIQYQLLQTVASLGTQAKSGKATTRKLLRKLEELSSQASVVKPECFAQYRNACTLSTKLGEFTYEVKNRIAQYVKGRREGAKTESIHQTIYNVTDTHLGVSETSMWDGCRKMLNGLLQDITTLAENVLDPEITVKVTRPDQVWVKRAKDMKAEVVVNFDAEQKAQSLQEQVVKLVKEAKLKDQALQESDVKIELLEKRMETFKKQAEQISILDRDVDKAKKQERDYDEAISALQADMAALEEQNALLRRSVKNKESRNITTPVKRSPHHGQHGHSGNAHEQDSTGAMATEGTETGSNRELLVQIESLKSALRFLRSENASLRTRAAMLDLGLTANMSALSGPVGRRSDVEAVPVPTSVDQPEFHRRQLKADTELKAVALETKRLLKDARAVCASPKLVDLS